MALRLMYRQHERYADKVAFVEAILQQAIQESNSSLQGHKQLGSLSQSDSLRDIAQVHGKPSGGKKELLYKQIDPRVSEHEEIVVTVQGFVLRCSLPPITRVDQLPKNPMAAKQSVTLTGLGSTEFEAAARAVLAIHTMFSSTLPDDALVPWKPQKDTDYVCLEFYNRYFKGRDETGSPAADIGTEIDPLGILRTRCPLGEHTEDNVVLYFERNTANITGTRTYTPCNPVGVRVGQLVEVQASFCVVPIAKGRFKT
ncbi:hypothetical protein BC629DRAFT_1438358 [Irpex lacteus]|nr:hypothetical protein BC629DRAFT_1438358 [Irpex lacteus]